jgi:hypothetical protein
MDDAFVEGHAYLTDAFLEKFDLSGVVLEKVLWQIHKVWRIAVLDLQPRKSCFLRVLQWIAC